MEVPTANLAAFSGAELAGVPLGTRNSSYFVFGDVFAFFAVFFAAWRVVAQVVLWRRDGNAAADRDFDEGRPEIGGSTT